MINLPVKLRFEQAVYGSFPFWHRGYAILAHSAGCRPTWLAELRSVCQRCGEPPAGLTLATSIFALRLNCGMWTIVGVQPQGCDDQGRPGALAFHALFLGRWAFRWTGADPFALARALAHDWTPADRDRTLPTVTWDVVEGIAARRAEPAGPHDPRLSEIVQALVQKRRVIVQASEPIDDLARSVWHHLPGPVRRQATVATWAFDNANGFNLVGMPKLAGVAVRASDLVFALESASR